MSKKRLSDTVTMPRWLFHFLIKQRPCPRCGYLPEKPIDELVQESTGDLLDAAGCSYD